MAKFKLIVSHDDGKSQVVEVDGPRAQPLVGKRIGERVDGVIAGLSGQMLQVTGGSDKDGFPMRANVHGGVKARIILSEGVGFHPKEGGARRRKLVRGSTITDDIVQVNLKVAKEQKEEVPKKAA
ncbi:MAG: small subunit ribosomal protein S6e [Thermoproteota archaeon]|nr:small subunit ribosomal protein S6e [Thermoproteota archaeon]